MQTDSEPKITPPIAIRKPHEIILGEVEGEDRGEGIMKGNEVIKLNDPYFWLRDKTKTNEEVLTYLKEENEYTEKRIKTDKSDVELYDSIKADIKSHIIENYETARYTFGDITKQKTYRTFEKHVEGKSHPLHYLEVTEGDETKDYLLLDENVYKSDEDPSKRCDVESVSISRNVNYLIFGLDTNGSEIYDVHLHNISEPASPTVVSHSLPPIPYADFEITYDEKYIIYALCDDSMRSNSLWIYDIASKVSKKIFKCDDVLADVEYSTSDDGSCLIINLSTYKSNTMYYLRMNDINFDAIESSDMHPKFKLIQIGTGNDKYKLKQIGDHFVILTNKLGFKNYFPMYCLIGEDCSQSNWSPIDKTRLEKKLGLQSSDVIYYEKITITANAIVISIRHNGVTKIALCNYYGKSGSLGYPFDSNWTVISPYEDAGHLEILACHYETSTLYLDYSSLVTPSVVMKYDITSKNVDIIKKYKIPNYDEDMYVTYRINAISHDGKKVPMTIVHRKEIEMGATPHRMHLYGYGAYGENVETQFNESILPLLDRGYIYVIVHVRGSSFIGNHWYDDGKMMNKMNTFLDFESAIDYMINNNYTTKELLSAEGRSAGGLLAGYCITKLSHKLNAVIAGVPFVDVLGTMSDPSIPLTTQEWEQWGNPNRRDHYEYMKQYSPYDNLVDGGKYCNCFLFGGINDPRVQYWEPAKYIAKLRHCEAEGEKKLQLLEIKLNDGHFSSSDRYKLCDELAKQYLFLFKSLKTNIIKP